LLYLFKKSLLSKKLGKFATSSGGNQIVFGAGLALGWSAHAERKKRI